MISAILLAAGESTRMGQPKALLPWQGAPLVVAQLQSLIDAGADEIVVVLGHDPVPISAVLPGKIVPAGSDRRLVSQATAEVRSERSGRTARLVKVANSLYWTGKVSSILAGVHAVPPGAITIVILGVDQPRPAWLIRQIIAAHHSAGARISVPYQGGHRGHPIVFDGQLRTELEMISEETQGLRAILDRHRASTNLVPFETPVVHLDLNTPEAYHRVLTTWDDLARDPGRSNEASPHPGCAGIPSVCPNPGSAGVPPAPGSQFAYDRSGQPPEEASTLAADTTPTIPSPTPGDRPAPASEQEEDPFERAVLTVLEMLGQLPPPVAQPVLISFVGLPGTGKSTIAAAVAGRIPIVILRSDAVRKRLFRRPRYTPAESGWVFRIVHEVLRRLLQRGHSVLLDATTLAQSQRRPIQQIAAETGARLLFVHIDAPPEVVRQRMDQRQTARTPGDLSDADWAVYEELQARFEPIREPHLKVDGCADPAVNAERIVAALEQGA